MRNWSSGSWKRTVVVIALIACVSVTLVFGLQATKTISSSGMIRYPPAPQVLLQNGFESGGFQAWNGTVTTANDTASVSSASPYEGFFGATFGTADASNSTRLAYCYEDVSPVLSDIHARGYFLISQGLPLNDVDDRFGLIAFEVGGVLQCTFRVYRSGGVDRFNVIGANESSVVSVSTDGIYPVQGRWFEAEFYIKVDAWGGEYAIWINGVEQIDVTGLNTTVYGSGVSRVRFGLPSTINVQHAVEVQFDSAAISTTYIGQERYTFGIVSSTSQVPAVCNFVFLFGNESISYRIISPSDVTRFEDVDRFDGLVLWTKQSSSYNATAIRMFAAVHPVIVDMNDFCQTMYPNLNASMQVVSTSTVTYAVDWGNFHAGDLVDMRNETGNSGQLTSVLTSALSQYSNVTTLARFDSTRTAMLFMNGTTANSGFFAMDLDATSPGTQWTGIWHVFPVVKNVQDFPTGTYAEWMANGPNWWNLSWVYNRIDAIVNQSNGVARKIIIGQSVNNQSIPAIIIGNGTKNAIIDGAIHGNEKTGTFAALRIAELLIQYELSDSYWQTKLTQYKVIIIPVLNPDGFATDTRENANGVDLNRQFPPVTNTTEPEVWALRNLMGNYTPTIYVNMHEGWYWYPNYMIYGSYVTGTNRTLTINALQQANQTFVNLQHYGWFTDDGMHTWIGKVLVIGYGDNTMGMASEYASYAYNASSTILETFLWSDAYGARQCLWGLDYYPAVILSFLRNLQR